MSKTICVSGVTGQTASYLVEQLLAEGHKVYGLIRRSSVFNTERINHLYDNPNLKLVYGDLADYSSILGFVGDVKPDEFYNLGAMSHVRVSFDIPEYTFDVTGTGVLRCLEAIRKVSPKTRFLQASSSELFGASPPPQNENTPFHPRSPYAVAKLAGYWATVNYREAYNLFACNSITYNHESPRRGETFVTRKITRAATRIKLGLQDKLLLGNLDAKRDWNHASDVARAMKLIMNLDFADDFVIGSGKMYSVQEFLELVFSKLDLDYKEFVEFDARLIRPAEVDALCADSSKIKIITGWEPLISFECLVDEMIECDMKLAEQERLIKEK
ncbi:MAG: GDP-mannose 4,6-dehydratase [bacterium]|nr:GDP-mannose 4,6-dehydratase [bacterium]